MSISLAYMINFDIWVTKNTARIRDNEVNSFTRKDGFTATKL